jgi:hypothetical protein
MTPEEVFRLRPAGSEGETENVGVDVKADGVTVLVADIAELIFVTRVCDAGESDGGG